MKRSIVFAGLIWSLALVGCQDPSGNLNSGYGSYGDIRDDIPLDYSLSEAEAAFLADYGISQAMLNSRDL